MIKNRKCCYFFCCRWRIRQITAAKRELAREYLTRNQHNLYFFHPELQIFSYTIHAYHLIVFYVFISFLFSKTVLLTRIQIVIVIYRFSCDIFRLINFSHVGQSVNFDRFYYCCFFMHLQWILINHSWVNSTTHLIIQIHSAIYWDTNRFQLIRHA